MAYDITEERLKVRGSEQITRDLKVNRNLFVGGSIETNGISGDLDVQGELIARKDLSVSGDLYVNGTEHINDTETAQTSDDYLVLRHNKTTALGANEHAGVVVHNYMPNKTATLTTDNTGTWRVADNTETETNYSNISYYNGTYYSGLGQGTTATVIDGIKSAWDEDELSECVFYNNDYYHFDGSSYFEVELSGNVMVLGTMVTDPDVITALEALTGYDLVYFRSLSVTTINEVENQPLLTRDEATNLANGHFLAWDSTGSKAVDSGVSPSDIPAAQIQSDWTQADNTAVDYIKNKPSLATVATSGDYNDLINTPSITPVDSVTDGNMNPVTSNAVFDFVCNNTLDWDNAQLIEMGDLNYSTVSGSGTIIDINGDSHTLSQGDTFTVAWNITNAGRLFALNNSYNQWDFHISRGTKGRPRKLSELTSSFLASLQFSDTTVFASPSNPTISAISDLWVLYNSTETATIHSWNGRASDIISKNSWNGTTNVSIPDKYFMKSSVSLIERIGIPVEPGMKLRANSSKKYPGGVSYEPPRVAIPFLLFVPYKAHN